MYRSGTNQKNMFDWLVEFNLADEKMFDVKDVLRNGDVISDVMARVYISAQSKVMGRKFTTKVKPDEMSRPRLFVTRTR